MKRYALLTPEKTHVQEIIEWKHDGTEGTDKHDIYKSFSAELGPRIVEACANCGPGSTFTPPKTFGLPPADENGSGSGGTGTEGEELPPMFAGPADKPSALDFESILYTMNFPFSRKKFTWGELLGLLTPGELRVLSITMLERNIDIAAINAGQSSALAASAHVVKGICETDGGIHLYHPAVINMLTSEISHGSGNYTYLLGSRGSSYNETLAKKHATRLAEFLTGGTATSTSECVKSLTGLEILKVSVDPSYAPANLASIQAASLALPDDDFHVVADGDIPPAPPADTQIGE